MVDVSSRVVTFQGRPDPLRAMEYRLLEYLVLRAGQVVSKAEILEHLYDFNAENFLQRHRSACLRPAKETGHGPAGTLIQTVRGLGYVIRETPA